MSYKVEPVCMGVTKWADYRAVAAEHHGWIAGTYVDGMSDIPFEVKLAQYEPGTERSGWAEPEKGTTLTWILEGSMTIYFKNENGHTETVSLQAGQMLRHENFVPHTWVVGTEGVSAITVRTKK